MNSATENFLRSALNKCTCDLDSLGLRIESKRADLKEAIAEGVRLNSLIAGLREVLDGKQ